MSTQAAVTSPYRRVIRSTLVQQVIILAVASMVMDEGFVAEVSLFATVAFWGGVALVRVRRVVPTRIDLMVIEYGYIAVWVMAFILSYWIGHLRGVM